MTDTYWTRRPDRRVEGRIYKLSRCPHKGRIHAVILSHDLVCAPTHYTAGRTRPCPGPNCETCAKNSIPRWHGYLAAIDLDKNAHIILELTHACIDRLAQWFDDHRTLRGTRILLERKGPRSNSPVGIRLAEPAPGTGELETPPDVRPILARMWEIRSEIGIEFHTANQPPAPPLQPTGTDDTDGID